MLQLFNKPNIRENIHTCNIIHTEKIACLFSNIHTEKHQTHTHTYTPLAAPKPTTLPPPTTTAITINEKGIHNFERGIDGKIWMEGGKCELLYL